jgi:putative membrane protein
MQQPLARTALAAALLALGFGASAQTATQSSSPSAQQSGKQQSSATQRGAASDSKAANGSAKSANGSTRAGNGDTKASALPGGERKFLEKAAAHGMAEVELGKLASQKASNPEVKRFGEMMVEHHGMANKELKQVASAKGVELPSGPDKDHQKKMEKMQKLSGAEFDREYMKNMVKDHKNDVGDFSKQAKNAKDPEVKAFAAKTLPTLQEHLKLAQSTEKTVTASARGSAGNDRSAAAPAGDRARVASRGSGGAPGSGTSPATGGSGTK